MKLKDEAAQLRRYAAEAEAEATRLEEQMKQKLAEASRARQAAYAMAPRGRPPREKN